MMIKHWAFILVAISITVTGICFTTLPPFHHENTTPVLRVGVLPDETVESLYLRYKPVIDYLSQKTGISTKLIIPSDYSSLVTLFSDREIDLAYFGGLTFLKANLLYHAEPLVMRDVDTKFTSSFIVRKEVPLQNITDFKGKKFAFGSQLSTSGHLMPRYFLQTEKNVFPEVFFSNVSYSGSHEKTAYLVRDGEVSLGVVNSEIVKAMFRNGRLKENDIRILWETPPYPDYVWAVQENLSEPIKTKIRDAFLALDLKDTSHRSILMGMSAEFYIPARTSDFESLTSVAEKMGLLIP